MDSELGRGSFWAKRPHCKHMGIHGGPASCINHGDVKWWGPLSKNSPSLGKCLPERNHAKDN